MHTGSPSSKKQRILLVDDHLGNVTALEAMLEGPDREIVSASSGVEALLTLIRQNYNFSLIILDVKMGVMDGFETARLVRGVNSGRDIPLIFYSSNTRSEVYLAEANRIGAVSYLNRSCDADVLCQMVNQILESGRPNQSN